MVWYTGLCNIMLTGVSKSTKRTLAEAENWAAFRLVFMRLYQDLYEQLSKYIKITCDTLSKRVILESLIWYGNVCIFEYKGGVVCLPATMDGSNLTIYGESRRCFVYSRNGQVNKNIPCYFEGQDLSTVDKSMGVIIWACPTREPLISSIIYYAKQIADSYRTLSVMRKRLKMPLIIQGDESQSQSISQFYEKYTTNEEVIHLDTGFLDVDKTKIVTMPSDADTAQLMELIDWYENKFRESIGVQSNSNIDKKGENLISDEVHVNDDYEDIQLNRILRYMENYIKIVRYIWGDIILVDADKEADDVKNNEDVQ